MKYVKTSIVVLIAPFIILILVCAWAYDYARRKK